MYCARASTTCKQPHTEVEVYYVIDGRAQFYYDGTDIPVESGAVLFVPAGVQHRFHKIEQDLKLLVFFAPAERTGS